MAQEPLRETLESPVESDNRSAAAAGDGWSSESVASVAASSSASGHSHGRSVYLRPIARAPEFVPRATNRVDLPQHQQHPPSVTIPQQAMPVVHVHPSPNSRFHARPLQNHGSVQYYGGLVDGDGAQVLLPLGPPPARDSTGAFRKLSWFRWLFLSHSPPPLSPSPKALYSSACFLSSPLPPFCGVSPTNPRSISDNSERFGTYVAGVVQEASDTDAYAAATLDSVVKVITISTSPNYFLPWQNKSQRVMMGSGFVIPGRRILTNAHVVADHTLILLRKHGFPTEYKAEVQAVGHECDLALLTVESEEFWEGMHFLELGDIPPLQEAVAVFGYPQGGDNVFVTKGVVSRVVLTQYFQGASRLMAIQIDATINPGNSGGPAIMGDKVAGVALQYIPSAQNIGYIIPLPVIKCFLSGVEETGNYVGFCSMGLSWQPTENAQLREHFRMCPGMTGVLVSQIHPLSDAHRMLKKDDVLLTFDGVPIANDGTVPFRNRERITFDHIVSTKKPNETAEVKVLRDGVEHEFCIILRPLQPLVPVNQFGKLPSYYIFAGLVFVPLTQRYLEDAYGEDWHSCSPRLLCESAVGELSEKAGEQIIILSQVLKDDINAGYECLSKLQVQRVNGEEVVNLKHLCKLVENCSKESLRFDLSDGRVILLNYHLARVATSRILRQYRIHAAMSEGLIDE